VRSRGRAFVGSCVDAFVRSCVCVGMWSAGIESAGIESAGMWSAGMGRRNRGGEIARKREMAWRPLRFGIYFGLSSAIVRWRVGDEAPRYIMKNVWFQENKLGENDCCLPI